MFFPTKTHDICLDWVQGLVTNSSWSKIPNRPVQSGEAGGYFVQSTDSFNRAYLKPVKHDGRFRAAYEKIASDIASQIGILVPPIMLYQQPNPTRTEEPLVCLSLLMYPVNHDLDELVNSDIINLDNIRSLLAISSGVIAFDIYLGNSDRQNNRNTMYGFDNDNPSDERIYFIDHSNSMNYESRWENEGYNNMFIPTFPLPLIQNLDWNVIKETANLISNLDESFITHIVNRIPDSFLPSKEKETIEKGLIARRSKIYPFLLSSKESGRISNAKI